MLMKIPPKNMSIRMIFQYFVMRFSPDLNVNKTKYIDEDVPYIEMDTIHFHEL